MKIVATWYTLIQLAKELGQARLTNDQLLIEEAQKKLEIYEKICLEADCVII